MVKTVDSNQVKITAFPMDNGIWCISWLGRFVRNPKVPSELSIEVTITALRKDANIEEINPSHKSSYDYSKTQKVLVGCSLLPILKIGSFWCNGVNIKLSSKKDYTTLEVNLLIDASTSELTDYKSSPKLFQGNYYVEIEKNKLSKLLIIDYPKSIEGKKFDKLIIPCIEVLRFYYARSSQLIRALLNNQLGQKPNGKKVKNEDSNKIYNPDITHSYCDSGVAHIHLRQTIPDKDAAHVARIAFSQYANLQARNIYGSGIKNESNLSQFLVEVRPPFEGTTTLVFEGKSVASAESSEIGWSFLVFQIKSCSHPFPFTQLTFSRDNDGRSKGDNEDKPESWNNAGKIQVKTVKTVEEIRISNEDEPSVNLQITDLEIIENAFPDLVNKDISKTEKESNDYKAAESQFISAEEGNDFSTGVGKYGETKFKPIITTRKDSQKRDDKQKRKEALKAGFDTFIEIILELSNFEGISYQYIEFNFDNNTPNNKGCSFFPLSINNWAYINLEQNRQRQFMSIEINYNEYFFYFFEIEADKFKRHERYSMFAIHCPQFNKMDEETLMPVIKICTKNYGRWLNDQDLPEIRRKRFKHTAIGSEDCAKKFFNYMQQQVQEVGNAQQQSSTNNPEGQLKNDVESYDGNVNSGKIA